MAHRLRSEDLIAAYRSGWFPMAEPDGEIFWYEPTRRGVIELDHLKVSRSLRQTIAKRVYDVRVDTVFRTVMEKCAEREETWISKEIIRAYSTLHRHGVAHSIETFREDKLVGGLYGVSLGGAFFGESMFSTMRDASKVALVSLVERLRARRYVLLDTQFVTPHLKTMGAVEISRDEYLRRLHGALHIDCTF